jgi:hypothetical protein
MPQVVLTCRPVGSPEIWEAGRLEACVPQLLRDRPSHNERPRAHAAREPGLDRFLQGQAVLLIWLAEDGSQRLAFPTTCARDCAASRVLTKRFVP